MKCGSDIVREIKGVPPQSVYALAMEGGYPLISSSQLAGSERACVDKSEGSFRGLTYRLLLNCHY